jgi:hypothetical protein
MTPVECAALVRAMPCDNSGRVDGAIAIPSRRLGPTLVTLAIGLPDRAARCHRIALKGSEVDDGMPCKIAVPVITMSQMGQSRRFRNATEESGSAPITDMQRLLRHVREVPIGDLGDVDVIGRDCPRRPVPPIKQTSPLQLIAGLLFCRLNGSIYTFNSSALAAIR